MAENDGEGVMNTALVSGARCMINMATRRRVRSLKTYNISVYITNFLKTYYIPL